MSDRSTANHTVEFNVGGRITKVSEEQVRSKPGTLLHALLEAHASDVPSQPIPVSVANSNPLLAQYVVNWYIYGRIVLPPSISMDEMRRECAHFRLPDDVVILRDNGSDAAEAPEHVTPTVTTFTLADVTPHDKEGDFWVVIDGYVLDLSAFLQQHPGTPSKIVKKRQQVGPDVSNNFLDHFGHTVKTFREACRRFEEARQPITFTFAERPKSSIKILGKVAR